MNVIDSFYFLFKAETGGARADIKQLDDQISVLAAKGQKRSEAETKELTSLRKMRTAGIRDLKDEGKAVDDLNLSFSKLALAGVAALEGFASLGKLKDGIVNAVNYNAQIEKTAKLTNINSRELAIWNSTIAKASGNPGSTGYLDFITQLNQQYAGLGINDRVKRVNEDLIGISRKFKELEDQSPGSSQALASKLGISSDLWLALKDGPDVLQKNIESLKLFNNTTAATSKKALEIKGNWQVVGDEFQSFFNDMQPVADVFTKTMIALGAAIRIIGLSAGAAYHSIAGLFELGLFNFHGAAKEFGKAGGDLSQAGSTFWKTGGYLSGQNTGSASNSTGEQESKAFWKSQGYSDAQVSSLLANEQAESGFIAGAIGDGGQARGIFQWHAPRRARILAATGIDVATAGHTDQLKAAAWELEQTGTADRLRAAQTPADGAAILTSYEAPANASYQAYARGQSANAYYASLGQSALASASSATIPAAGGGDKSFSIGSLVINSQATDGKGVSKDVIDALNKQFGTTAQAFDDGVKY